MTDFSSLKSKVDDLKAKVAQNSISPAYLGALLDDFITAMQSIDVTGMSDEVRSALANSASALAKANEALSKADASDATAVLAAKSAVKAADDAAAALEQAAAAVAAASSASQAANTALASAAEAITASDAAKAAADDATAAITDFGGRLDANDTKTAQLSTRVNTLTDKVAGISILPFDGVFDPPTDGSVIQFPARGVWWQPHEGNFLFLSSDLGYVAADYNADGAARTDRIFRHDNILYRYDGSSLVSNEASLEKIAAKTAQLTPRVDTLTDKVAAMNILPFDGVFNPPTDGSVVQYPAGGVWWQPQEGNFLFLSSDFGYVAADYNAPSQAGFILGRTDRIFCHDNILYHFTGRGNTLLGAGVNDWEAEKINSIPRITDRLENQENFSNVIAGVFDGQIKELKARVDAIEEASEALDLAKTELEAADAELRQWTGGRLDDLDSMIGQEVNRVEQSIIGVSSEIESVNCTLSDDISLLRDAMDDLEGDVSYLQGMVTDHLAYPQGYYYGVRIDESSGDPVVQRIGNPALHLTLPIQSKMRRCILKDDGSVAYYLHPSDSTKKADGTPANLDGSDGMYMVEIPEHYAQFMHTSDVVAVLISEYPLPGFRKVRKMYRSAVEATIDRRSPQLPKLAAVCNTTASFRGSGYMKSDWDTTSNSQLGRPATNETLNSFRTKARNRGTSGFNGAGWNCDMYEAVRTTYWLYVIEYANRNCQLPFNPEPNSSGYRQGGLGEGVTTVKNAASTEYYPFIPCGITNSLGNASGVVNYTTGIIQDNTALKVAVPSYRGIENPFGHINSIVDGCLILIKSDGTSTLYTCDDPALFVAPDHGNADLSNYKECGDINNAGGYIKSIVYGDNGDIFPRIVNSGATSGTYYCDNYAALSTSGMEMAVVPTHGGAFDNGYSAGMICWRPKTDSYAYPNIGTRLCFIPEN